MEILQTVLEVLTSDNITLFSICSYIFSAIEIYLFVLILSTLSSTFISLKRKLIVVISLVIIGFIAQTIIPSPYYSFVNLIFMLLLPIIILKIPILKCIASAICLYLISLFFGVIYLVLYTAIFNCEANIFKDILIYKIVFSLSIDLTLYSFYLLFKKFNITLDFIDGFKQHSLLIFNLLLGFVTLVLQLIIAYLYFDYIPMTLNIFSSLILYMIILEALNMILIILFKPLEVIFHQIICQH